MSLPMQTSTPPRRRQQMKACDACRRRKVRCDSVNKSQCSNCRKLDKECSFTSNWERPVRIRSLRSRSQMSPVGAAQGLQGSQAPTQLPSSSTSISPAATQNSHSVSNASWDVGSLVNSAVTSQFMARDSLHQFFEHGMGAEHWEVFDNSTLMRLAYVGTSVSNLSHLMNLDPQRIPGLSAASLHLPHPHTHPITPWKPTFEQTLFNMQLQGGGGMDPFRDLSSFPVKHIRDALVEAFFEKVNPYFPVIDESEFRRQYADPSNPPPLIIMHSVLLAGAHVCSHPRVAQSRAVVTATLFFRAKALFDMRHENNRVHLIQCALLLTWHLENSDSAGANSYYWAGLACRIAFGLGMHRNLSPRLRACMMPLGERRIYRRVWWTLFQTEIFTALEHGRPSMIQLDEVDQPPLEPDDFREENGAINEKLNFRYCSGNIELCYIILEILWLNRPRVMMGLHVDTHATLAALDSRLVDWILTNPGSDDFPSLLLHLHYNTVLIHLHRKFIPTDTTWSMSSTTQSAQAAQMAQAVQVAQAAQAAQASQAAQSGQTTQVPQAPQATQTSQAPRLPSAPPTMQGYQQQSKSTEICGRAAGAIITTFETMLTKNFIAQCPFTATIALTAAAIHISLEIRLAIEAGSTLLALNTQNSLERLFEPCKELSQYWPNAEGVLKLFQSLLEKFKSKVVSILRSASRREASATENSGIREQTLPPIGQDGGACPGPHQDGGGGDGQYLNFNADTKIPPDVNPMMDALDWQDILFYNVIQ